MSSTARNAANEEEEPLTVHSAAAATTEENVVCPLCQLRVPLKLVHNHMGAHILLEADWSKYKKEKPAMPCGLCGERSAIMCSDEIAADQVQGCPVSAGMKKPAGGGKATLKPNHQCKLLPGLTYSLTSRASSSVHSPCTNRPVRCPICNLWGWSYNMEAHVAAGACRALHGSPTLKAFAPKYHEHEWLLPFLHKTKTTLKPCKIAGCACGHAAGDGKKGKAKAAR